MGPKASTIQLPELWINIYGGAAQPRIGTNFTQKMITRTRRSGSEIRTT